MSSKLVRPISSKWRDERFIIITFGIITYNLLFGFRFGPKLISIKPRTVVVVFFVFLHLFRGLHTSGYYPVLAVQLQ